MRDHPDQFLVSSRRFFKKIVESLREFEFTRNHPDYPQYCLVSHASYSPWRNDPAFQTGYELVRESTLVDIYRCYELWHLISEVHSIEGDILEVGVWRGGTGALLAIAAKNFGIAANIWLVDTFAGVVKAGDRDSKYRGGEHADTSIEIVKTLLQRAGVTPNTSILSGVYPDDFSVHRSTQCKLRFVHIDVDAYQSAFDIFQNIWGRLVPGGIVVFDDYGFWGCEGVTTLVTQLKLPGARRIYNLNGHAVLVKLHPD